MMMSREVMKRRAIVLGVCLLVNCIVNILIQEVGVRAFPSHAKRIYLTMYVVVGVCALIWVMIGVWFGLKCDKACRNQPIPRKD